MLVITYAAQGPHRATLVIMPVTLGINLKL